jgi:predicted amidohydrolase
MKLALSLILILSWADMTARAADTDRQLVVALLQLKPHGNNLEANADKAEEYCRKARAQGADIALLPEMWSIGYTRFKPDVPGDKEKFYQRARSVDSSYVRRFGALARELGMAIAFTYLQAWDPLPRNAVTLFDRNGKEVFTYAKVHTSDFKSMEASMTPGDDFYVGRLDTAKGPVDVGAMICFDREQPESARLLMLKGAEIILTPNACGLDELRLDQFKVRAWENVVGVAMANYPEPAQNGHSVAYNASGECVGKAGQTEGIYLAKFDLESLRRRRARSIWGNAYRRPHRYGLLTSRKKDDVWSRTDGNGKPYDAAKR